MLALSRAHLFSYRGFSTPHFSKENKNQSPKYFQVLRRVYLPRVSENNVGARRIANSVSDGS
eukprot:6381708-Amphidinium_carterae.1